MIVESWLVRAARTRPSVAAVGDLDYATLLSCARACAHEAGLAPNRRVGLALPPGEGFAIALHATLLAGAIAVPLDLRLTPAERPPVDVVLDAPPSRVAADGRVTPPPLAAGGERHDLDAVAIEVRTSGTSGRPKAIGLTYGNWLWSALGSATALGHPATERWLCTLPLSHVGGLSILMRSAIAATTAIVHERFDTERVLAALRDPAGATIVSVVPTTLSRLLDGGLNAPPALRWALLGGAPAPPSLLTRAAEAGVPVAPTYGMTEACSQIATAGVPLFCTRIELADDGEILVGGPTVAPGVVDPADGLLHSGDLGEWDGQGRLTIVGRSADTIISGGENVAPSEVEAVLEAHDSVLEAGVVGVPDREWGEALVALVRLADDDRPPASELRGHCAGALARFKIPKRFLVVAEPLPRTASGKLLRRELAGPASSSPQLPG